MADGIGSEQLEQVSCNLCGGEEAAFFLSKDSLNVVKCSNCGLIYVNPRPTQSITVQQYDEHYYSQGSYSDYLSERPGYEGTFKRRLQKIERTTRPGRILDVGCAFGFFLVEAEKRGWEAHGVDVSPASCRYAVGQLSLRAFCGTLSEASFPSGYFDVVIMNDTFEHLSDPSHELLEVWRVMRQGGHLFLVTQDASRLLVRLLGRRWPQYKPREHLYYFTTETLRRMLRKTGFEVLEIGDEGLVCTVDFLVGKLRNLWSPAGQVAKWIVHTLGVGQVLLPVWTGYEVMVCAWKVGQDNPAPYST